MADSTKKPPTPEPAAKPAPAGGRAAESGDPAVHQLLARRQTAVMNGDEQAVKDIDGELADLGYTE